ncbi:MAG: glutathione peroxidase [Hyphomicrobiales bacterium]|jgi:glutathione peroxidase|nr:glutathione peroxidase [Hyphomicrobiales bacterium]
MIDRRAVLGAGLVVMAAPGAEAAAHAYSFDGIEGGVINLGDFRGKLLMVVNTASRCGFTNQYAGLQALWTRYRSRGLTIIGVPSNDFAGQEPGSNEEIRGFCSQRFGVTFPMAAKTTVIGEDAHPFYRWAARERPSDTPRWNFHKYLIGRDGRVTSVFPTSVEPTDARVLTAIERAFTAPGGTS